VARDLASMATCNLYSVREVLATRLAVAERREPRRRVDRKPSVSCIETLEARRAFLRGKIQDVDAELVRRSQRWSA
jgi:hypothetical protein